MNTRACLLLAASLCLGCISVPDDIQADFAPPDGKRPNNFGRFDERGRVCPDRPTIHSATETAPVESRS